MDSDTKRRLSSAVTQASGVGGMGLLAHLRSVLREDALGNAEEELDGQEIRFDTIGRVAYEETRKSYIRILDDPLALEAIKKALTT